MSSFNFMPMAPAFIPLKTPVFNETGSGNVADSEGTKKLGLFLNYMAMKFKVEAVEGKDNKGKGYVGIKGFEEVDIEKTGWMEDVTNDYEAAFGVSQVTEEAINDWLEDWLGSDSSSYPRAIDYSYAWEEISDKYKSHKGKHAGSNDMDVLITWIVQMEADRKYNWAVNRVSDPTSYEEGGILAKAGKNDLQILRPYGLEKPTYTIENKDEILDAFSRLVKENTGKINKLLEELESDAVKTDVLRKKIAELGKDIMVLPYSISSMFAEGGTVDYSELQRVLTALKDDPRTVLEENYFNPAEAHNSQLVGKDGKDWRSPVLDTLNKAYNTPISYGMQVSSTNQMNRSNYKRQKDETLAKIERENEEELSVKRSQASHNAKRKQEIEASEKQNQARDKQIAKDAKAGMQAHGAKRKG